jgi:hypothetical protein
MSSHFVCRPVAVLLDEKGELAAIGNVDERKIMFLH